MQILSNILLLTIALSTYVSAVRIGSFNLHQYGSKKAANATLTNVIADIINDFDLAIIQEISDVSLQAPYVLFDALNEISKPNFYTMTLSERVGRSATKEQFIFFNRESTSGVEVVESYVYQDPPEDYFEREPFIATFKVKKPGKSGVKLFTVMDVHLRPDDAFTELLAMRRVIEDFIANHPQYFDQTSKSFNDALEGNVIDATADNKPHLKSNHPILIVGDFNADCTYISPTRQNLLRTINYVDFTWIINNEVKTNTRQSCTYDRILINGDNFVNAIVPDSNTTVNYQEKYGMTLTQALGVSDHFPIKFDINW
jgi:endonuclease/exonuclease/phosphatase family metal-dependent hydrolase